MTKYMPWWPTPKHWKGYSDPLSAAKTKVLRRLLYNDERIIGFVNEGHDGVVIYTNSALWCDDAGCGEFRGCTESEAVRNFKAWVMSRSAYEGNNPSSTEEEA